LAALETLNENRLSCVRNRNCNFNHVAREGGKIP
jgi:hypothetical protein